MAKASDALVSEWTQEIELARRFYEQHVEPTGVYSRALRSNAALWESLKSWPEGYHQITANLIYADTQTNQARVLARHPKIHVVPATRATRMAQRMEGQSGLERFIAAAIVQQMVNWRWREFDFSRQTLRVSRDAETRGFGLVRHGFKAEDETTLMRRNKRIELEHHQHIRPGWPYAVHWPVSRVLWDQKAREPDERQWVAFLDWWRPEDLKQKFGLRREIAPTHTLGADLVKATAGAQSEFGGITESVFGRVGLWEIWDRRRGELLHMVDRSDEILQVSDWPLDLEGLPDTMLWPQEDNERMWPVPDCSLTWELQQLLNVMLSMLAVYIKRGVPVIAMEEAAMEKSEREKLEAAEILEFIIHRGGVQDPVKMLNLQPPIQHLILGIQTVLELRRQVGGNSKMLHGARENLESATEASLVATGGELRNDHRARAVEEFAAKMIRKDWQIFQQTVSGTQVLDVVGHSAAPLLVKLSPDQIKAEYEFSIQVGSTEPASENKERLRITGLMAAANGDPQVRAQFRPEFWARRLSEAFGYDPLETLTTAKAAEQQIMVDALETALFSGGGRGNGSSIGAALDAMKTQGNGAMPQ